MVAITHTITESAAGSQGSSQAEGSSKSETGVSTFNSSTTIGSLNDLLTKGSEGVKVYKAMMQGLAMQIMQSSQKHNDRLIKMMKENRRNS